MTGITRRGTARLLAGGALTAALARPAAAKAATAAPAAPPGWELLTWARARDRFIFPGIQDMDEPVSFVIRSEANNLDVATEVRYPDSSQYVLRARTHLMLPEDRPGWELFDMEWNPAGTTVSIRSRATGLYVATERNYPGSASGLLRARSTGVGGWESFWLYYYNEPPQGRDPFEYALASVANGRFVTVEMRNSGSLEYALRARSTGIGGWERFQILDLWG